MFARRLPASGQSGTLESLMTNRDTPNELQSQTIAQLAELAGGLAHELRNPLSTMKVNLKLLAEDLSDESARFEDIRRRALIKVNVLKREADRLQSVFDDFLNLTGSQGLQRQPIDLNAVVDRLIEFFEPMATSQGIALHKVVGVDPLVCPVDEKLLSQALLNLVVNAKDAMPQGGTLTFETRQEGEWAVVSVTDTGIGIAPEDRERIFKPFFSNKASGTGLGLSLTRRIVQEHGGTLGVTSAVGQGTTFALRLPLQLGAAEATG